WRLDLGELSEVGLSLGADIPVCLSRRAARMRGIGEKVEPLNQAHRAQLAGRPVLLVNPLEPLETKAVFAAYAAMGGQSSVSKEGQGPRPNDLLGPALDHCPTIGQILSALEGAISVRDFGMSGSGPTCFALFDRIADCQTTARDIACAYPEWWVRSSHLI
ncbi:MAG: 4-(cytidine 5'-diphospho)-2-C-methyl-D-erythritol kinase, partial [Pseudomonadota bacterium]